MPDDKHKTTLPSWLSERPYGGALPPSPEPAMPDIGKLPAMSLYERHPEWKPRRAPWRRSIRKRLESA
jgi:hypothetical protein